MDIDAAFKNQRYREMVDYLTDLFQTTKDPNVLINLAAAYAQLDVPESALRVLDHYLRVKSTDEHDYAVWTNRSFVYIKRHDLEKALDALIHALNLKPTPEGWVNLGIVYRHLGDIDRSLWAYQEAFKIDTEFDPVKFSGYLVTLHYIDVPNATLLAEHKVFAETYLPPALHISEHNPTNSRPRIGYLSGDFRQHSVGYFIQGVVENHSKDVQIVLLHDSVFYDNTTKSLQSHATQFIHTANLATDELVSMVRGLRLDALIDLIGHSDRPRSVALARRMAPVQCTWIGYPNVTGIPAVDYRFVDDITDPVVADNPHEDDFEQLIRIPGGFLGYRPLDDAPAVAPKRYPDYPVFGCFNYPAKMQDRCIATWARILKAVPESRLMLKGKGYNDPALDKTLQIKFAQQGISAERLLLQGFIPNSVAALDAYNKVDVCLDPFPYNGTTTTFEALWMGRPVVALFGDRHVSRVGASILHHSGLGNLVASTEDEYVDNAVDAMADTEARNEMIRVGRAYLLQTPMFQPKRIANFIEQFVRDQLA